MAKQLSAKAPTAIETLDSNTKKQLDSGDSQTSDGEEEKPSLDLHENRYECSSCGYVYDPMDGVKKFGIVKGTPFSNLDKESFRCPVCRASVASFRDIGPRSRPSGFEENLNYGFGVNNLTSGQKNVLIFGGLALVVAFFLSLYSLR